METPALPLLATRGELMGMAGVVPSADAEVGQAWMLGAPVLRKYSIQFLRGCAPLVSGWHEKYPVLFNFVDERNTLHIKWLRWLGFVFVQRYEVFGVERIPFLEFVRLHDNVLPNVGH